MKEKENESKRVLGLIRVSTLLQPSIPDQRLSNERTAAQHGLEVVRSFEIADVSGSAVLRTPEVQELLELIGDPNIHGVVAREFSRLMRPEDFGDFVILQRFAETKTLLYLPDGPIDFSTKGGRLMGGLRALMAGAEKTDMIEASINSKERRRREGKFTGSPRNMSYGVGYDRPNSKWFYTAEASIVAELYRLFLSGETNYKELARKLGLSYRRVPCLLTNPIYTGWRVIEEKCDPSPGARRWTVDGRQAKRRMIRRAPEDIIRVKVLEEGIVSEVDFAKVQAIIARKKTGHWQQLGGNHKRWAYGGGVLTCATCGRMLLTRGGLWKKRGGTLQDYYVCKGRARKLGCPTGFLRRDTVDEQLDLLLHERLTDPKVLKKIARDYEQAASARTTPVKVEQLTARLSSLAGKRQRILDAYFDGTIRQDERDTRLAGQAAELKATEEALAQAQPRASVSVESLVEVFAPFQQWATLSRDRKAKLLRTLQVEIHIADYRVTGISVGLLNSEIPNVSGHCIKQRHNFMTSPNAMLHSCTFLPFAAQLALPKDRRTRA